MINARIHVKNALLTVCDNVKVSKPAGDPELPLVVYAQVGNTPINLAYVRLKWRINVYCSTRSELIELCDEVDRVMSEELGFTRVSMSGDDTARIKTDVYTTRMDYAGLVNTKTLEVIKHSS